MDAEPVRLRARAAQLVTRDVQPERARRLQPETSAEKLAAPAKTISRIMRDARCSLRNALKCCPLRGVRQRTKPVQRPANESN